MTWLRIFYSTPAQLTYTIVIVALVLLVWLRGGRWERMAAAAQIIASLITPLVQDTHNLGGPQPAYVVVDAGTFVVLTIIALRSRLWWATWAASFQLLGVFLGVAMIVDEQVAFSAYHRGIGLYTYPLIAAIMVGTLMRPPLVRAGRVPRR